MNDALTDAMVAMGVPLDSIAHIIQLALTPVFLLSGIAALLNVITTRLGRVADQHEALLDRMRGATAAEQADLKRRAQAILRRVRALDIARCLGALGGVSTCAATFALFLGALQNTGIASLLFVLFGASVLCTMAALLAFLCESLLSWPRPTVNPHLDE
jgi:hypothetical protein